MSLAETIQKDLVSAMRAKEELKLSVLRGVKAAIKHREIEKIRALDESESIQILQMLVKQRKESIEQFTKGNRPELAEKETKELAILESYLPASASIAEMDAAIDKAVAETNATSIKQMCAVVQARLVPSLLAGLGRSSGHGGRLQHCGVALIARDNPIEFLQIIQLRDRNVDVLQLKRSRVA